MGHVADGSWTCPGHVRLLEASPLLQQRPVDPVGAEEGVVAQGREAVGAETAVRQGVQ